VIESAFPNAYGAVGHLALRRRMIVAHLKILKVYWQRRLLDREEKRAKRESLRRNDDQYFEDWHAEHKWEYDLFDSETAGVWTESLIKRARRLDLPIPDRSDEKRWEYAPTGGMILTLEAIRELRAAVRKAQRQSIQYRIAVVVGILTIISIVSVLIPHFYSAPKSVEQGPAASIKIGSGPLAEWQQVLVLTTISQFPGHKVLILAGIGDETAAYAAQFRDLFLKASWIVDGPRPAPINQVVFDVQVSMDQYIFTHPEVQNILSALDSARIRHRPGTHDPNIPSDWLVLWIGARAPANEPDHLPLQVPPETFRK
jgi:hypothetical protein